MLQHNNSIYGSNPKPWALNPGGTKSAQTSSKKQKNVRRHKAMASGYLSRSLGRRLPSFFLWQRRLFTDSDSSASLCRRNFSTDSDSSGLESPSEEEEDEASLKEREQQENKYHEPVALVTGASRGLGLEFVSNSIRSNLTQSIYAHFICFIYYIRKTYKVCQINAHAHMIDGLVVLKWWSVGVSANLSFFLCANR